MKKEEMTKIVRSELQYLPKDEVGSLQNEMRKMYNSRRRHDLAINKTRRETLQFCIQVIKSKDPSFIPEYDQSFFGKVEKKPRSNLIKRFREWRKNVETARSANELLKVIVEEKDKSSSLKNELIAEREKRNNLEIKLKTIKGILAKREFEIKRLNEHVHHLEEEFKIVLEVCLLSYLKEQKGTISIKDCATKLNVKETQIKKTLDTLIKKGKIKIEL